MNEIEHLDLSVDQNLNKFGLLYAKTLDKIAMPIEEGGFQEVSESLFEI